MNWSILPILVPFSATAALAWAALWLVDRLCERSGPGCDPVAWIAKEWGRVISEEFDRRCVHGDGRPQADPAVVSEGPSPAGCSNRDAANRDAAYAAYLARPGMSYGEWRAIRYLEPDQSEAVCPNEYDVSRSYRSMGIMTRNEVRESMGLPHLEDVRREEPEWLRW